MTLSRRDFTRLFATAAAAGVTLPRSLGALTLRPQTTHFTWQPIGSGTSRDSWSSFQNRFENPAK